MGILGLLVKYAHESAIKDKNTCVEDIFKTLGK